MGIPPVRPSRVTSPIFFFLLCLAVLSPARAEEPGAVTLKNEFIRVVVSSGEGEEGRFAIETTGGNPDAPADDNQPLLYGRPRPWTSFTTLRIDGQDWVFGGSTRRRAGLGGQYGQRGQAPLLTGQGAGQEILTIYQLGPLRVSQRLSLVRSQTTRMKDAALIRYDLTNTSAAPVQAGARLLLDTLLGSNDGAPFRAAGRAVTTETLLSGAEVPEFWQAFDNLNNPAVVIEGVLRGQHLTTPGLVAVANWGTLADHLWDFAPTPGRSFEREGEAEMDSALALYYPPAPIAPGQTLSLVTQVGVGGITTKPGNLSLGLTARSEIAFHPRTPPVIPVVAYVQNTSGFSASGVVVKLLTSPGLSVVGAAEASLGALSPSGQADGFFQVRANGSSHAPQWLKAVVVSENFEENSVERPVTILDPPRLSATVQVPESLALNAHNQYDNNPFQALLTVENPTVWPIEDVQVALATAPGLDPAQYEKPQRTLRLPPGGKETVDFHVLANGRASGVLSLSFAITAPDVAPLSPQAGVLVPPQQPRLLVKPQEAPVVKGGYAFFDVAVEGMRGLKNGAATVTWNPKTLRFVRLSDGTMSFWPGMKIKGGVKEAKSLGVFDFTATGAWFDGQDGIMRLHFKVLSEHPEICVQGRLVASDNMPIQIMGLRPDQTFCLK